MCQEDARAYGIEAKNQIEWISPLSCVHRPSSYICTVRVVGFFIVL